MAVKRKQPLLTGGDMRLLLCAAAFLGAVLFKYADANTVQMFRMRAANLLTGVKGWTQSVSVFGGQKDEDTVAVFAPGDADYAASSGTADDISGRELTSYPNTVDQTVYRMAFAHADPVAGGTVSSTFGSRVSPITGNKGFHYGLDIAATEGTSIGAFADGEVRETGQQKSYGRYVIIDHEGGFATLYAHCSSVTAQPGEKVSAGQEVAKVGATGAATGNHLHLEIWKDGNALNPADYVTYT